jgi:hypothetical protein
MKRIQIRSVIGCLCVVICAGSTDSTSAAVQRCPNETLRTGRSASLPDCRAYELVTPEDLSRTEAMIFENGQDHATVSSDGKHVALVAKGAYLEPGVSFQGTADVFSRSAEGWVMKSVVAPGMDGEQIYAETIHLLMSPDLSQIAFLSSTELGESVKGILRTGPIGGPYVTFASVAKGGSGTSLEGVNAGTSVIPTFSDLVFASQDHTLLPPGPEREQAEKIEAGASDLYDWSHGRLQLVNLDGDGRLLNQCGAVLGASANGGGAINAVSADGSRVFFTSPEFQGRPGCFEPALYMRVDGSETVDISEPEGVSVRPSERTPVRFDGATTDGSRVFFTTANALIPGAGGGFHLYEYDVEAPVGHRLKLIANEANSIEQFNNPNVVFSEDGSTLYYEAEGSIFRYETTTGKKSFVATPRAAISTPPEGSYTTPDGRFLLFVSGNPIEPGPLFAGPHGWPELIEESRGAHHEELYRYSAADGSVICVSCGEGVAPPNGNMLEPEPGFGLLSTADSPRVAVSASEDGRRVFFQTSARLVPQDTNESTVEEELGNQLGKGADTYEWEQYGTEEVPGMLCRVVLGCTHLLSAGEAVGPERFLGASLNGRDVFFTSAAQLVPQATPEFVNIYDARADGGFQRPAPAGECTSCQGVGSVQPQFTTPASETFAGAGNPAASAPVPKPKSKCRHESQRGRSSRCVRGVRRKSKR